MNESLLKFTIEQIDVDKEPETSQEEREDITVCEQDIQRTNRNDILLLDYDVRNWSIPLSDPDGLRIEIIKKRIFSKERGNIRSDIKIRRTYDRTNSAVK